jgi:hypothetical protein
MTANVNAAIEAMLAAGASRRIYTYADDRGNACQVQAYLVSDFTRDRYFDTFFQEHWPKLKAEPVTLFSELFMQPYTIEMVMREAERGNVLPANPSLLNTWLFLGRSLELQLSLLDAFGYGQGSSAEAQTRDCRELLRIIDQALPFNVFIASDKTVGLAFTRKPTRDIVDLFFDPLVAFMRRYERLEFSPSSLRKEIIRSSNVIF